MKEEKKDESKGMKKRDTYNFTGQAAAFQVQNSSTHFVTL